MYLLKFCAFSRLFENTFADIGICRTFVSNKHKNTHIMYSDNKTVTIENHPMIGQVIKSLCTGLEVDATVLEVTENKHKVTFHCKLHQDVQWGDQTFTKDTCSMRKFDQWIIGTKTVTAEQFLAHK